MKYRETVPSESGHYWTANEEAIELFNGRWISDSDYIFAQRLEAMLPLLGPLPANNDDSYARWRTLPLPPPRHGAGDAGTYHKHLNLKASNQNG